jgi:hypothetical protein
MVIAVFVTTESMVIAMVEIIIMSNSWVDIIAISWVDIVPIAMDGGDSDTDISAPVVLYVIQVSPEELSEFTYTRTQP